MERVRADFHDIHEREYSRRFEESDIELPNVRVRGVGLMPPLAHDRGRGRRRVARPAHYVTRARPGSTWTERSSRFATRSYERAALKAGNRLAGPAIVNQYDTTTVIPPGMEAHVDRFGNIVIEVAASAEARALAAATDAAADV